MANRYGTKNADSLTASANGQSLYGGTAISSLINTGNDKLNSSTYVDVSLYGGDGNDTLIAKSSDLVIDGGTGTDTVQFAATVGFHDDDWLLGVENVVITSKNGGSYDFSDQTEALSITGGGAADTIYGGSAADTLKGGDGNDALHVQVTDKLIDGGTGTDTVWFSTDVTVLTNATLVNVERIRFDRGVAGSYSFSSQTEALDIAASDSGDMITAGAGADTLRGGSAADSLLGDKGNDVLIAAEDDTIDGGEGVDTVQFASDVTATLTDNHLKLVEKVLITASAAGSYDFSVQFEALEITGSGYVDAVTGGAANDSISGLAGNDILLGNAGSDTLNGGAGDDTLEGGAGVDRLIGDVGNDVLIADASDALIDGGAGVDTVRFAAAVTGLSDSAFVRVEKVEITNTGHASYDFGAQTEGLAITGNSGDDSMAGSKGADSITGGAGDDSLTGNAGADTLLGGGGDDTLVAEETDALIDGGAGVDTVVFRTAVSASRLTDSKLVYVEQVFIDNTKTASYDFTAQAEGLDVTGSGVADSITGGKGADSIDGGAGNDTLKGGLGNDTLLGGAGADVIDGGAGADTYRYADAAESCMANAAATSILAAGIDKVSLASGDTFDFQGLSVTFTASSPIEITIPDVAKRQLTAGDFMQAIAAVINESASQAFLVKVTDQDKQSGSDGNFTGSYLIVTTDDTLSDNDFIVQLVGVDPVGVTGSIGGSGSNISVI